MYHVPLAFQCIYGDKSEDGDGKEGREWRVLGLLYEHYLVVCGESKENLGTMVGRFVELCKKRGLKVNADKSKMMVLNGEERWECDIYVDGIRLEHISEFKYLGCFGKFRNI